MAFRRHKKKPALERKIALERIDKLFLEADNAFKERPDLSNRYVELARRIAMKLKVRIRPGLKKRLCKHCHCYLKQGSNCRVRLSDKHVTYTCLSCKKMMRFPYRKESSKII